MDVHIHNASIYHFAWHFKPDECPPDHVMAPACDLWRLYRQKLDWEGTASVLPTTTSVLPTTTSVLPTTTTQATTTVITTVTPTSYVHTYRSSARG